MGEPVAVKFVFGEKEEMQQLSDFLKYGGLSSVILRCEEGAEENEAYYIEIDQNEEALARRLTSVFYKERDKTHKKEYDNSEVTEELKEEKTGAPFVKASDKAANYRSSAFALLSVGFLGLIFMILIMIGVISISIAPNIRVLSFITMTFLFAVFVVMGCKALSDAKKYEERSKEEEQSMDDLRSWFLEQHTKELLDEKAGILEFDGATEEMKYYMRTEIMRKLISEKFGELEASFLENNIEDLYTELYEH
ncbi:MAG: hypothetical protein QM697_09235 [Lachnospiraceae bacterium]